MVASPRFQKLPLSASQVRNLGDRPLLRDILALPPSEISEQLRVRWRGLSAPLNKLAKLLLSATPVRSASWGAERWLLLEHRRAVKVARGSGLDPADFEPERTTVWLPERLQKTVWNKPCVP